ncbi:MAG: Rdx family protein [Deltaproteobacteria bacterium]|nr:Rdx family protein [Deltaproteobacteria bacterium]
MAEAIQEKFGITATLIKGRGGAFEVKLDEQLLYSKKSTGRFPDSGEVETAVQDLLSA